MTRKLVLATAAVAALAACGRGDGQDEASAGLRGGVEAPAALPAANTAAGFASRVATVDLFETRSSQIALERTQNADVRRFAQLMLDDHGRTGRELQAVVAAQKLNVVAPNRPDAPREELLGRLREAAAADFDDRYIDQQTEAHENTLQLLRDYADTGDNPALKDWARRTAPAIENHLQMVKALDRGQADGPAGANPPRVQGR